MRRISVTATALLTGLATVAGQRRGVRLPRFRRFVVRAIVILAAVVGFRIVALRATDSDIGWNISAQAASHATVLGLFTTATAVFLYMTIQWSVMSRQTQAAREDMNNRTHRAALDLVSYNETCAWAALLLGLISFGMAAFVCALLVGLIQSGPVTSPGPYLVMTNVFALYLWGIFLVTLGGMYFARLFNLNLTSAVFNTMILRLVGFVGLVGVNFSATVVGLTLPGSYAEWPVYVAVALLVTDGVGPKRASIQRALENRTRAVGRLSNTLATLPVISLYMGTSWFIRRSWLNGTQDHRVLFVWLCWLLVSS